VSKNVEDAWGDTFDITDTTDEELVDSRKFSVNVTDRDGELQPLVKGLIEADTVDSRSKALDRAMRMYLVYLFREYDIEDRREAYGLNTSLPPLEMEFDPLDVEVGEVDETRNQLTMQTTEGVREYLYDLLDDEAFPYDKQTYLVANAVRWRSGLESDT
jgi:hypothetical protein